MKLSLDYTQRLNLHFLMGAQRGSVDEVRLWWRLQDQIELNEKEKKEINYRVQKVGELEQPMWDLRPSKLRDFEFTDDEVARVQKIVREWQHGFSASDRRWLEPLLAQFEPLKVNGNAPNEAALQPGHRA